MIMPPSVREFAMPRSRLSTSMGGSVVVAVSAKVSLTPNRNSAASTTAVSTRRVMIDAISTVRIVTRTSPVVMTMARLLTRSATTPA